MSILKKIEIKGLWGTTDIEWELDPHVNILGGINGSGKSTLLNIVASIIYDINFIPPFFEDAYLYEEKKHIWAKTLKGNLRQIQQQLFAMGDDKAAEEVFENIRKDHYIYNGIPFEQVVDLLLVTEIKDGKNQPVIPQHLKKVYSTERISTFETPLVDLQAAQKYLSNTFIKTNLDFELTKLEEKYVNYRLNLGQRIQSVLDENLEEVNYKELHTETYRFKQEFENIINNLFSETDKKINYQEGTNKLQFIKNDKILTPYQLSSGEKQLLIILLTVLIQDNKASIMLMDEPEVSLHIDWQKKLIGYIRELNLNAQLIMVTHSPGLIMEKWIDHVTEISEISKPMKSE
ncbi:MAG: ATP-binding protein [Cytophagales bacterium]|nr:ATP-binding protein [Cytophagales bacterium]